MKHTILTTPEVLSGYDAVSNLYPYVPPLSHWRAWEYAAYRKCQLEGRILDVGCGDGAYFRLNWPNAADVVGLDVSPGVADAARRSGVYQAVHVCHANQIPEGNGTFDHAFANCSLEHMDHLDEVLAEINRCLKLGGSLLCSVVTDLFMEWSLLPDLIAMAGYGGAAKALQEDFLDYHHLTNALSVEEWQRRFERAGLVAEMHIPILPKFNSGIFLLMDSIWHVKRTMGGELGDVIYPFLLDNSNFPGSFRKVIEGLLGMETDWHNCSGAVFLARKRSE